MWQNKQIPAPAPSSHADPPYAAPKETLHTVATFILPGRSREKDKTEERELHIASSAVTPSFSQNLPSSGQLWQD